MLLLARTNALSLSPSLPLSLSRVLCLSCLCYLSDNLPAQQPHHDDDDHDHSYH